MPKAAFVVLTGPDTPDGRSHVVNAMEAAREFDEHGDEFQLIFDGAGTQWVRELEDENHKYHHLYAGLRDAVSVCDYCVGAYEVDDAVDDADIERREEFDGHPSIHSLIAEGYEIVTF